MATVEVNVPKPVPVVLPDPTVTLTLSVDEAQVIKALVGSVGGTNSFRKLVTDVWQALEDAGVDTGDSLYWKIRPEITFKVDGGDPEFVRSANSFDK